MTTTTLPAFQHINLQNVPHQLEALLKNNLAAIDALCEQTTFTWDNVMRPLENISDQLHQFWSPIQHMSAVINSAALRDIMHACLPKLSDYHTHLAHHEKLFRAIEQIKNSAAFNTFSDAQKMAIDHELRDFKLNGIDLPADKKARFADLMKTLSQETHQFEENLLDATMAFKKHVTDESLLAGIPDHAKNAASAAAQKENLAGYLFTLEAPSYIAIMTFADNSALRYEMYHAYVTRASDISADNKFDNSLLMKSILKNRAELASLLGFDSYADYSLATKMVKTPQEVISFLEELAQKSYPQAQKEFAALAEFAKNQLGLEKLNPWDVAYAAEKFRQHAYDFSPETLRPYFPENKVLPGLFNIIDRLYDITVEKIDTIETWHPDVKCFVLKNKSGDPIAYLYMDLYARANKRGGAWMDECLIRRRLDNGELQLPAAYVTCNFNAPVGDQPALFSHDDVVTLFHECGHALQHMLTRIETAFVSGIRGIPWDAVEIASQFFENWAWEKASVDCFAQHYKTNALIPDDLFKKMDRAKNFQSAMQMMRQLEFSLFDFRIHRDHDGSEHIQSILDDTRHQWSVVPVADFNRFQHGFSHIFGGSYAAGYYSYKWAEVMACDAFSLFEEKGIFDHDSSEKFKRTFLESGGAVDPMTVFIDFRGRKPTVDALLQQSGIG